MGTLLDWNKEYYTMDNVSKYDFDINKYFRMANTILFIFL